MKTARAQREDNFIKNYFHNFPLLQHSRSLRSLLHHKRFLFAETIYIALSPSGGNFSLPRATKRQPGCSGSVASNQETGKWLTYTAPRRTHTANPEGSVGQTNG